MPVPTEAITAHRLERWAAKLSKEHATPLVLVAVGHDHAQGKLVIVTLEEPELDVGVLAVILRSALRELEGG